jgi:hypothetical protein
MKIDEAVTSSFGQNGWNNNFLRYSAVERVSVLEKSGGINKKNDTPEYFDVSRNILNVIKPYNKEFTELGHIILQFT